MKKPLLIVVAFAIGFVVAESIPVKMIDHSSQELSSSRTVAAEYRLNRSTEIAVAVDDDPWMVPVVGKTT